MGIRRLLLLLIYLDPLSVLCAATGGKKVKHKAIESSVAAAIPTASPAGQHSTEDHETYLGYGHDTYLGYYMT